ncbi:hypothetical protein [Tatumella punctata]|uniref:Uncharacterized protein n=1 Tax=Tatumella punctata TaxID=399969 RepID=A0ABW1VPR4_9GAMM
MLPASEAKEMAEAYIASLTAEPTHYVFNHPNGKLFNALVDESCKGHKDVHPGYTAPPVPVIKLPDEDFELGEAHGIQRRVDFRNGANYVIAEIKRLNGLGE